MLNLNKHKKLNVKLNQHSSLRTAYMCMCIIVYQKAQNSSDYLPPYPPDNRYFPDVVCWRTGKNISVHSISCRTRASHEHLHCGIRADPRPSVYEIGLSFSTELERAAKTSPKTTFQRQLKAKQPRPVLEQTISRWPGYCRLHFHVHGCTSMYISPAGISTCSAREHWRQLRLTQTSLRFFLV